MTHPNLRRLMSRGTDFLGCDYAIMCGAMSWVSERNLVSARKLCGTTVLRSSRRRPPESRGVDRKLPSPKAHGRPQPPLSESSA